jgi:hypothetical protein
LLLGALILWNNSSKPASVPELVPVMMPDTKEEAKGKPNGGGGNPGNPDGLQEHVGDDEEAKEGFNPNKAALNKPADDPPVDLPPDKDGRRTIINGKVLEELGKIGKRTFQTLAQRKRSPKDKGTKDKDGGPNKDSKDGKGALDAKRVERQLRWRVQFSTMTGADYQDQLHALGAVLVVPEFQKGTNLLKYRLVIRDLSKSPAATKVEDVRKIKGIFWIDDKEESVKSLAKALRIKAPPLFACFFPEKVEHDLRKLERAKFNGKENEIDETVFRMVASKKGPYKGKDTKYKLVCEMVVRKR